MALRTKLVAGSRCLFLPEVLRGKAGHTCVIFGLRAPTSVPGFRYPSFTSTARYSVSVHPASTKKDSTDNIQSSSSDSNPNDEPPVIIYEGILKAQLRSVKLFSLTTSVMGLAMQPVIIERLGTKSVGALVAALGMVGFFTYVTPFLIHYLAKRYVTEMTHDPKSDVYSATTYSFFLRKVELKFKVEDVIKPELPGPFTTLLVRQGNKKIPLFLADTAFIDISHFGRFMGYDKPIDFKLTPKEVQNVVKLKNSLEAKSKLPK